MKALLRLLLLLPAGLPALAWAGQTLPEFRAVYEAEWKGLHLGDIVIQLAREQGDCYRYQSQAKPVAMVRMFYGKPREISRFCVVDGQVQPHQFVYQAGKDSFQLDFNWRAQKVFGGIGERELPGDAQDRLGMHQAVRLWVMEQGSALPEEPFRFTMVQDDKMDRYALSLTGIESVTVPNGEFEALKLERVDRPDRIARFWLAETRDYMPVKVETGKEDVQLRMSLKSFETYESEAEPADDTGAMVDATDMAGQDPEMSEWPVDETHATPAEAEPVEQ